MRALILAASMMAAHSAAASTLLFADDFSDAIGNNINGTPNASVTGVYAKTGANNYNGLVGTFMETGGRASIAAPAASSSGLLYPLIDFATDSDVRNSGSLTISLGDIAPASGQWLAVNILHNLAGGQNIYVNNGAQTTLGILFTASGSTQVFESGSGTGSPLNRTADDVSIVLTNITGLGTASGSFDYEIFSGATSLFSDSHTGNLTNLYVGLESRTGTSSLDSLEIATVPGAEFARLAAYIGEINVAINTYGRTDLIPYRDELQAAYDNQTWDIARIDAEIARKESLFYRVDLETAAEKKYKIKRRIPVEPVESSFPVGFTQAIAGNQQFIAYYDKDKNMCVGYRTLEETSFHKVTLNSKIGWDSHNYITMIVDDEGYIHISGNMHNVQLKYWRSTNPYDASSFQALHSMVGSLEDNTTYPNFLITNSGDLLFHYRYGWSGNGYEVYNIWNPQTRTWSRFLAEPLIDGQGQRNAYMKGPFYEDDGYYHLYWVWRGTPDAATNHDFSYARSADLIHWETATGTPVSRPMVFGESGLKVDPSSATSGNGILNGVQAHVMDSQNRIVLANMKYDELGNSQFYVYRLKPDGIWEEKRVTNWLYRFVFGGGGSLVFEVNMRGMRNLGNGELGLSYTHSKYGNGEIIIDEETLEPVATREYVYPYPEELNEVTITGTYSKKIEAKINRLGNYLMRWEAMGASNDQQPSGTLPPDIMLEVIELEPVTANAGFESPEVTDSLSNPTDAGWTFEADSGVAHNGSGLTSGNDDAPEGAQVAFIRGNGTITQAISDLTPGTTYHIAFSASQRQNAVQAGQTFDVVVDGVVAGSFEPSQASVGYADFTAGFIATETSHTVRFAGTNLRGGDNTAFIDNIHLIIANRPAEFVSDPVRAVAATAGENYSGTLADLAVDSDGDPLAFSKISGPAWLGVSPTGALSGVPGDRATGDNSFVVGVTDGNGATDFATLHILVYSQIQNVVANYRFESPATATFVGNPTGAGWAFSGSGVAANGSAFTSGNANAPDGTQVAYLQGTGSISQILSGLTPGATYEVTFAASQRQNKTGGQPGQTFDARIDGVVTGSFEPSQASAGYADVSFRFTATSSQHTLAFAGTNLNGGDNTAFIDHIRLNQILNPIPPQIHAIEVSTNGQIVLSWHSEVGQSYTILYSTSLAEDSWIPIKTGISGSEPSTTEAVTISAGEPKAFFLIQIE